ncbi:MAG: helix-turn-helix transcriptional regulator [Candidatus Eremiobacteraeota bacterium]|nr:helix-turn-helix transcriptional regulator [Candidatus Eremiobacteraeota bacterium]
MDDILDTVGKALTQQRVERGFSLEEAEDRSGIDISRIARGEAGELRLTEEELGALADAYGIDVTAFFGGRITPIQYLAGA